MNVDNKRLYDMGKLSEGYKRQILSNESVKSVPEHLQGDAEKELDGNAEVVVENKSPLAKWAEKVRKNLGQE